MNDDFDFFGQSFFFLVGLFVCFVWFSFSFLLCVGGRMRSRTGSTSVESGKSSPSLSRKAEATAVPTALADAPPSLQKGRFGEKKNFF